MSADADSLDHHMELDTPFDAVGSENDLNTVAAGFGRCLVAVKDQCMLSLSYSIGRQVVASVVEKDCCMLAADLELDPGMEGSLGETVP
jgi:hypothetical protein